MAMLTLTGAHITCWHWAAARLMSAIDAVREVVSADMAPDAEVADAVLYYSFDVEQAVTWLLDQHGRAAVRLTLVRCYEQQF